MKNRKYIIWSLVCLAAIVAVVFFLIKKNQTSQAPQIPAIEQQNDVAVNQQQSDNQNVEAGNQGIQNNPQTVDPMPDALSRITKKPFGIFIIPKTSPVQPERFQGYHTGSDLETTSDEQNADVAVVALCEGNLLVKRFASGYGGLAVQACVLDGQNVTVIYGHLNLATIEAKIGDDLKSGNFLGYLGKGFSSETDGERKHLHLGIHKGDGIDILGYVQAKSQLFEWLDPAKYLK